MQFFYYHEKFTFQDENFLPLDFFFDNLLTIKQTQNLKIFFH